MMFLSLIKYLKTKFLKFFNFKFVYLTKELNKYKMK